MRTTLSENKPSSSILTALQYAVLVSGMLYVGRSLFIPLSFAVLISFVLYPVCKWLERRSIRKTPSILISLSLVILLFTVALGLLAHQLSSFLKEWPILQTKLINGLSDVSDYVSDSLAVSKDRQKDWIIQLGNSSYASLFAALKQFLTTTASNLVLLVIIPVFSALILFYRELLVEVLFLLFPKQSKYSIQNIIKLTIGSYYSFIKGMIIVYTLVGILNSVGLLLLGVPHAIFFGFVAAILTFIPYIGIVVGSLLPMTMAWITFNSVWYAAGVVLVFAFVQYLEANVIFPLTVSNRLNINALATLVAIIVGGILWGVSGMILFVPFLGIIKLIADRHPHLKILSLLIGTGKRPINNNIT